MMRDAIPYFDLYQDFTIDPMILPIRYGMCVWRMLAEEQDMLTLAQPVLPGWTGCNQILGSDLHPLSAIGYLPVIDASPTDKSTVNAILEKSLDIADSLNLSAVVLVMDQAIYAKAQEIRWHGRPEFRDQLIIRLGEFHTAMAFLGAVGKRFGDAGLRDIAIESNLVAEGSINGVISGHHYNRSLRCHKILSEAMHRLRIQEYVDQLPPDKSQEAISVMQSIHDSFPNAFMSSLKTDSVRHFLKEYEEYVKTRCGQSHMYAFWTSYLEMVDLLLLFLRGTREGNWELHLSSVRDMIPWFFAYGRINYSRYLPVYYLEMRALPSTHPFVHSHLSNGEFAVKRHDDHGFSMTACDQVIEQTFNRDSKTRGGLTGITLNKGAVRRWILSHPDRAAIANACYNMSCTTYEKSSSKPETVASRTRTDELAVQDVMMTITGFSNPFASETDDHDDEIVNICTGKVAPECVRSDLSSAFDNGEECFKNFVNERLLEGQKDVFDKLVLPTGKTFSDIDKKVKSKATQATASMKENRDLLARLLMIAQEKELDLTDILRYPLSSMSHALANFDGSMVKTTKAVLLHEVEKTVQGQLVTKGIVFNIDNVVIVDAMVLIQQQHHFPETFGEFAALILQQLVSLAKKYNANRVDFVAHRYKATSIKQSERQKRATQGETKIRITRADQKMPRQMKKFLACGSNKEGLLTFLVEVSPHSLSNIQLYATQGEACFKLHKSTEENLVVENVPELQSDQEEADTRMLLHAFHASQSASVPADIIICTVDTDVFVLALWVSTLLTARLILYLMTGNRSRKLDLQEMSSKMDEQTAEALVGLHPFTGCDSVSSFKGKGKVKALKLMLNSPIYKRAFCELGKYWAVQHSLQRDLERFVCDWYGWKDCDDVNIVRYNCFRFGCVSDLTLPPNSDSLKLHMMRANYQARIYRCCQQKRIMAPDPEEHGWKMTESQLTIKWKTLPIAPDNVLQNINCSCKKTLCNSNKCSCKKAGIECTAMCRCGECHNRKQPQVDNTSDDSDSDSD